MSPQRIQRRRTKGWRMPEGAVYVGRGSKWGNPFGAGMHQELRLVSVRVRPDDTVNAGGDMVFRPVRLSLESVLALYRDALEPLPADDPFGDPQPLDVTVHDVRHELRGRDLVCWCPLDQPCHADVLLELANQEPQ